LEKSSGIKAKAQKYLSSGNLDKALAEYENLLSLEDIDPYDYVLVGDVHLKKGGTGRAVSLYVHAIDAYEKLGLYKNAAAIGKRILRLDPSQSDMYRRLGDIRMRAGLAPEAVQDFLTCHDMKLKEGDKDAAIEALELASRANPVDTSISEKLAGLYEQTNRASQAAGELTRISEVLKSRGEVERAAQYAARAVKLDANVVPMVSAAAREPQTLFLERTPAESSAAPFSPQQEAPPQGPEEFVAATAAMEIAQPPVASRPEADQPVESVEFPQPAPVHGGEPPVSGLKLRAHSRPSTVNVSQVLKQFKAQMESTLDPGDYQSHYDLGVTYKEMGLHEEALNEFRMASAGDGFRGKAFEMAGLCHLEMEEFEEAVEAFRRALRERTREDEEYPGLCFNLGRALEGIGQTEEALQNYTEVAALNPQFPGLRERLAATSDKPEEAES
jgi:tetratricopeptide (TPR) repeat protein